jgi:AraC family transcriptional regulator of adaptative response / DNA-3-methyladenine glycosylase II
MTQIALNSGFSSIRQFNESFRSAYSISPSELRKSARGGDQGHGETGITIRLTYRPPFAWDRLVAFLLPRQIPEIEHVGPDRYARTVRYPDGTAGTLEVSPLAGEHALLARFTPIPIHGLAGMVQRVRSMFDLDADPAAIDAVLSEDPALSPLMAERPGLRIPGIWDVFEFVVRAILGQQVSVKSATTMAARLVRLTATPAGEVSARVTPGGFLFPDPETLAAADLSQLAVTESRRKTLAVFSQNVATGALSLDSPELPQRLIELPGIGPWTVAYTAMRALGEPDILPASDLVLRKAVGAALPGRTGRPLMSVRDVEQRGNSWRPWRSYATMYLWDRWL